MAAIFDINETMYVKADVIAKLFGLTVRRVQQITQEGIIHTENAPGGRRYNFVSTMQEYVKHLSDKAYGKTASADNETALKEQKLKAEVRLKESQAELHQLKTDIAAGKYLSLDEVKLDYGRFMTNFKKLALAIPSRVAGMVGAVVDPVQAREIENDLNREISDMLTSFVMAAEADDGKK